MLIEKKEGSGQSFQIVISPFDEPGPLTLERIRQDLPDMAVEEPQKASIGGAEALVFFTSDASLGKTREVWFVWPEDPGLYGNYLYRVTSRSEFDAELSKIMATFKFN